MPNLNNPETVTIEISPVLSNRQLNGLFRACHPDHEDESYEHTLGQCLLHVGAFADGELVGFCKVATDGDAHSFLLDPTVNPNHRRRGLGRRLIEAAVAACREDENLEWLHVDYEPYLAPFYHGCGFRPTAAGCIRLKGRDESRSSDAFAAHEIHLETDRLVLRPFTREDFAVAEAYYQDPEFAKWMEGNPNVRHDRNALQRIGEVMVRTGYLFAGVEKATKRVVGELCIQWMNLERGLRPGERVMRLPIGLWDKSLWGQGFGGEVIDAAMAYAFETLRVDRLCAMDVLTDSARSRGLFTSRGFEVVRDTEDGGVDLEITRSRYLTTAIDRGPSQLGPTPDR